jgi:hypothetical protein
VDAEQEAFKHRLAEGRIPVADKNVRFLPVNDSEAFRKRVVERSRDADLTIVGFDLDGLAARGPELFGDHPELRDVLFVCARRRIVLT